MDKDYINHRLKKLSALFYGKDCKPFAKEKKGSFTFGSKKKEIKNKVSKQVALYLVSGDTKSFMK